MYDATDPGTVLNEFLITLFLPGITMFVALWTVFRLVIDDTLRGLGLPPLEPASGATLMVSGAGRILLLILLTALSLLPHLVLYLRFLRDPLREHGIV